MKQGLWVIAYDIADDRRRYRLDRCLSDHGTRVQYSVFEAHLTNTELGRLRREIRGLIRKDEDSVRFYPLCLRCADEQQWDGGMERDGEPDYYLF